MRKIPMRFKKEYTTHMPMLIKCVQMTDGAVLELGAGLFSTPLLHWLLAESRRDLFTYESDEKYLDFSISFRSRHHVIRLVDDWDKIDISGKWSVAFIDQVTERRAIDAIRLKDNCDYVVLHDSETDHYKYSTVYPHFKYRYDWTFCKPWTTVISNTKDVTKWNSQS